MSNPPTDAQMRAMAYAPIPCATLSFLSSSYVIYYLVCKERRRLDRLYHRLVLAMNLALLPLMFTYAWSTFAVPEGTPGYVGASGTQATCTAQGFVALVFTLTVPTYYGSLVLQAYLGIKNNFRESNYVWIEKWVHVFAYCIPCAYAIVVAATENFNPNGSGCWYAKAPSGCESDPNVECERGEDISSFIYIVGFSQVALYFVYPPLVVLAMYCWMKKVQKKSMRGSVGMSLIRESARRQMMQSAYLQISLYLFSFWFTWVFGLVHNLYQVVTGEMVYNLLVFANCIFSLQGVIFAGVYFTLQRMGRPKVECIRHSTNTQFTSQPSSSCVSGIRKERLTVSDIRSNAKRKTEMGLQEAIDDIAESFNFNIFDGVPDQDSPWAQYIDQDEESSKDEEGEDGMSDEDEEKG